jgi:hypothetical protein
MGYENSAYYNHIEKQRLLQWDNRTGYKSLSLQNKRTALINIKPPSILYPSRTPLAVANNSLLSFSESMPSTSKYASPLQKRSKQSIAHTLVYLTSFHPNPPPASPKSTHHVTNSPIPRPRNFLHPTRSTVRQWRHETMSKHARSLGVWRTRFCTDTALRPRAFW